MAKLPNVTGWDFIQNDPPPCPLCNQPFPQAPAVLVSEDHGVALVGSKPFKVTPSQARVLQVLASAYGRFMQPEDVLDCAYSDRPEADVPTSLSPVSSALHAIRTQIKSTGYVIEFKKACGYRLIHETQIKEGKDEGAKKSIHRSKPGAAELPKGSDAARTARRADYPPRYRSSDW